MLLSQFDVLKLGDEDILGVILTTKEGHSAKRPHQAFLLLRDPDSGLDISYAMQVKESGRATVELVSEIVHQLAIEFCC